MSSRALALPALLACLAASLPARADDAVPPELRTLRKGLWESTMNGVDPGQAMMAAAAQRLESLPPEKRARLEAMLKQQAAARGAAAPTKHQFCLTQEKLDRKDPTLDFSGRLQTECTRKVTDRRPGAITFHATCTHEGRTTELDFHYELKSRESIAGSTTVMAEVKGQPLRTTIDFSAHWVAESCGEVK